MSKSLFTPSLSALAAVGLTPEMLQSDQDIIELIVLGVESRALSEYQEAVAIYTAIQRGHDYEWVLKSTGVPERTARRRFIEGMAIVRTGDPLDAVTSVRVGDLTESAVDEVTKGRLSQSAKLENLRALAFGTAITSSWQVKDGDRVSKIEPAQIREAFVQAQDSVLSNEEPVDARTLVKAISSFGKEMGLVKKVAKRKSQGKADETGPFGVEWHMRATLSDIDAIEAASDGETYIPTPQDVKALLDVATRLGLALDLSPEMAEAIEALVSL